jgi:hypothetical protein
MFHRTSIEAEKLFGEISKEKLTKMHNDFIVAMGGKIKSLNKKDKGQSLEKKKKSLEEIREKFPNAYRPWGNSEDEKLVKLFNKNTAIKDLAKEFGRKRGAISSRLKKLGLIED